MIKTGFRKGFINRHETPLPDYSCQIEIIKTDSYQSQIMSCDWIPFDASKYHKDHMPSKGYLGTARKNAGEYKGIGFHAWKQNDHEFIYYIFNK